MDRATILQRWNVACLLVNLNGYAEFVVLNSHMHNKVQIWLTDLGWGVTMKIGYSLQLGDLKMKIKRHLYIKNGQNQKTKPLYVLFDILLFAQI